MDFSSQKREIFFLDHQQGYHDCIHFTFHTSSKYLKAQLLHLFIIDLF